MNRKNTFITIITSGLCLGLVGCVEENLEIKLPIPKGDEVFFGARAGIENADGITKTTYAGNGDILESFRDKTGKDFESIAWDYSEDKIQIYCPQSPIEYSHYKVIEGDSGYSYLQRTGDASIQWKNDTDKHDFYAMYPSNEMFEGEGDAVVTLKKGVQMDRTSLTGTIPILQTPKEIKTTELNGNTCYIAVPNMDFAYMAAKTTGVTKYKDNQQQGVSLTFVPIVTAVQIELTMNSSQMIKDVNIGEIYIDGSGIAGDFKADLAQWENEKTYPPCSMVGSGANRITISTWVEKDGSRVPLTLKSGESLILTVFLNPGAGKIDDLKVTISALGGTGLGKILSGLSLAPHIKTVIKDLELPKTGIEIENSKWIELMPDEISLKALSIPGTGNSFSEAADEGFQSQKLKFADQWKLGIRAFEITTDRPSSATALFEDEYVKCNRESLGVQVKTVFNDIKQLLSQNPKEFALVILNYQSEDENPARDVTEYAKAVASFYDSYTKKYKDEVNNQTAEIFKLYSPDLTLDDVRGKIMLVMRTNQEDEDSRSAFEGVKEAIGNRNIIAVDGCGSAKDKWRRRGYRIGESIENSLPALNIWDTDGNDAISEGKLIEDYMVGTSSNRNGTVTWKNNNWNHIIFPEEDYAGDFSYNCTTGESDETFKVWFQEWARVSPEPTNNQNFTQYYVGNCSGLMVTTTYYFTRWAGSYNEKLRHAQKAFQTSISGGLIGEDNVPHVFINSLCGYFIDNEDKNSFTPWYDNPDDHAAHVFGSGLDWPSGGMSGNIAALATKINNDFYNYVLNSGYEQATGPTGVVMIDMVSNDPADGGSYYLPGVIIGNNFKFTLDIPQYPSGSAEIEDWEQVELN